MKLNPNRVDASRLTKKERASLQPLLELARRKQHPSLKGADGTEIPLPKPIFKLLIQVIQDMHQGKAVVLHLEEEAFTTQAAATFLGMSRQYFVTLLESGLIPFHRVGSHRRVYFKDLRAYAKQRDAERHAGLNRLFKRLQDTGHYDTGHTGGDA